MNSIDRNQREDNDQHVYEQEAVKKIKEMVEQAETCFSGEIRRLIIELDS